MRAARLKHFRHRLGTIAAALIAAAVAFGVATDSRAQNQQDPHAQKKAAPKAPVVRAPIKGAIKGPVPFNRNVVVPGMRPGLPHGPMPGPNALPQNARTL